MSINDIKPDNRTEDEKLKSLLKLTSILLFVCFVTLITILLTGCNTLRYRYDLALQQVPRGANIVDINNSYIRYQDTNNVTWVMYYDSNGRVYNVIDENQIPTKK